MDRRNSTAAVVAGIGILAIALASATLTSTVVPEPGVGGAGDLGVGLPPPAERPFDSIEPPGTTPFPLLLVVLVALAVLGYVLLSRRDAIPVLVGTIVLAGLIWLLFQLVPGTLTPARPPSTMPMNGSWSGNGAGDGGIGTGDAIPPALVTVLLLGVASLGALLVLARSSTPRSSIGTRVRATPANPDFGALRYATGRAPDRKVRSVDVANEVYRAWTEMTSLIDVSNPDATAPREFAAAAIDAGMAAEDVYELTGLFEDVRYGGHHPTPVREQRAVRAFRRIEATYASE